MRKSLGSPDYNRFVALLVAARKKAALSQQTLADRLERPQSFVAKYESGERRLDVVEFVTIARAMRADPLALFKAFLGERSSSRSGRR